MFNFYESILLFVIHGLFLEPSLSQNLSGSKVTPVWRDIKPHYNYS